MKVTRILKAGLAVIGLSLMAEITMAATCDFGPNFGPVINTQALAGGTITAGRDVPLGAEIYRQSYRYSDPNNAILYCTPFSSYNLTTLNWPSSTPLPLSSWAGTPYGGYVYETGVPGIGAVLLESPRNRPMPSDTTETICSPTSSQCRVRPAVGMDFDLLFIKIGDVSPGIIQGSSLPTASNFIITSDTLEIQRIGFNGSIAIVSRTCSTPDINVPMGTHQLSEFSGKNSFTPWKSFSIELNDCPSFSGYFQGSGPTGDEAGGFTNLDSRKNNLLRVRLDPTRTAINPTLGILSLNTSASGDTPAATGVGLQIGDFFGQPLQLATLGPSSINPQAVEGAYYTIAFKARYIQTEDSITPGPANATATFTIDYN